MTTDRIIAAPGAEFEATLDGATDLAGSLTVGIYDTPDEIVALYGPSSAGIVETPADSGLYAVTLTAPDDAGTYSVVWTDGDLFARDVLEVVDAAAVAVKLDRTVYRRSSNGALYAGNSKQIYVLQPNGPLDRAVDLETETLVEGFADEDLTESLGTGPVTSNADGQFDVFFPAGYYDLYAPEDATNPITRWQPIAGAVPAEVASLSAAVTAFDARADALERNRPARDVREFAEGIAIAPYGASEATCNVLADSSAQMLTAIDGAIAAGVALYVPAGTIKMSCDYDSGLHMFGAPGGKSRLILPALDYVGGILGSGTAGESADDVIFEDLVLDGQQQQRSISCSNALLKAYKARRHTLIRLIVKNGTSYGIGYQGYPAEASAGKRDIAADLYIEQCYVTDCGWIGGTAGTPRSGVNNSSDNIDIKSSERVVINKLYSAYSSDPCLDIRSRGADLYGVVVEGCQGAGIELDCHHPNAAGGYPDNDSHFRVIGGSARGCLSSGLAVSNSSGVSGTPAAMYTDIIGFHSHENVNGMGSPEPSAGAELHVSIKGGKYVNNSQFGLQHTSATTLVIQGATVRGNDVDGIRLEDQDGGIITGNVVRNQSGFGIVSVGTSDNLIVRDNDVRDNANNIALVGAHNIASPNLTGDIDSTWISVASAATVQLPTHSDLISVTGTTNIGDIVRSYVGRRVTLHFTGSLTLQQGGGSGLLLAGGVNFAVTANDTITLVCHNVNYWLEIARSVN